MNEIEKNERVELYRKSNEIPKKEWKKERNTLQIIILKNEKNGKENWKKTVKKKRIKKKKERKNWDKIRKVGIKEAEEKEL